MYTSALNTSNYSCAKKLEKTKSIRYKTAAWYKTYNRTTISAVFQVSFHPASWISLKLKILHDAQDFCQPIKKHIYWTFILHL